MGLSVKVVALVAVIVLIGAGFAVYEIAKVPNQSKKSSEIEAKIVSINYPKELKTNSFLTIRINATADKVFVQMDINGVMKNYTAEKNNDFHLNVPVKEGIYKIDYVYAVKGNSSAKKYVNATLKAFDDPIIEKMIYDKKLKPGENETVKIYARDTSGIKEAYLLLYSPDGKIKRVKGMNGTVGEYLFKFAVKEEPEYKFSAIFKDPFNNTASANGTVISRDNPQILRVSYQPQLKPGENEKIVIEARDTSGIKDAYLLLHSPDGSVEKIVPTKRGDNYTFIFPIKEEPKYKFSAVFEDPFDNKAFTNGTIVSKDNPKILNVQYSPHVLPGENETIIIETKDTSGIVNSYMLVKAPDGKITNITPIIKGDNYTFVFPVKEEPKYDFSAVFIDPFNDKTYYNGSISSLDSPIIHYLSVKKYASKGLVEILMNATDTSGIKDAEIYLNGSYKEMKKLDNGTYFLNVSMGENPENLSFYAIAKDPFNQTSEMKSCIYWLLKDAFIYFSVKNGFNVTDALNFYNNYTSLVKKFYMSDRSGVLKTMELWKDNSTLLSKSDEIVEKNDVIKDKELVLLNMAKSLYDIGKDELRDWSIWYLSNFTNYKGDEVAKEFKNLSDVLNYTDREKIALSGLNKEWVNGSETEILAYLIMDDKKYAYLYPYAVWALVKQAGIISKWLGLNYTDKLSFNGTNYSMREIVNEDFRKIANYTKSGDMVLGLKPEELLNLIPSNNSHKNRIADNWMREKLLPQAMFYTIWPKAIFAWEVYKDFAWTGEVGNGPSVPWFKVFRPEVALKVAADNIKAFEKLHNDSVYLINHPDEEFQIGHVKKTAYQLVRDEIYYMGNYFPHTVNESLKDFKLLYNNGSEIAKIGILMYGKALADELVYSNNGTNGSRFDEIRVEQTIGDLWSIGLPGFRGDVSYPPDCDHPGPGWFHGSPSFIITPSDIQLLYNRSSKQLLMELDKKTFAYHIFASRLEPIIDDKSFYADIYLPSIQLYRYWSRE